MQDVYKNQLPVLNAALLWLNDHLDFLCVCGFVTNKKKGKNVFSVSTAP